MSSILSGGILRYRRRSSTAVGHGGRAGPTACTAGPLVREVRIPAPLALPVQRRDLYIFLHLASLWPESEVFLHRCAGQDRTRRLPREAFKAKCKGRSPWQPGAGDISGRWARVARIASTSKVRILPPHCSDAD